VVTLPANEATEIEQYGDDWRSDRGDRSLRHDDSNQLRVGSSAEKLTVEEIEAEHIRRVIAGTRTSMKRRRFSASIRQRSTASARNSKLGSPLFQLGQNAIHPVLESCTMHDADSVNEVTENYK
jgi:hypothetical protein